MLRANNNIRANTSSVYFKPLIVCVVMFKKMHQATFSECKMPVWSQIFLLLFQSLQHLFNFLKSEMDKNSILFSLKFTSVTCAEQTTLRIKDAFLTAKFMI